MSCCNCAFRLGPLVSLRAREAATPCHLPTKSCLASLDRKRAVKYPGQTQHCSPKRLKVDSKIVVHAATSSTTRLDEKDISARINNAARLLNEMMDEIHDEAFLSSAVSEVMGDKPDVTEDDAIKQTVARRIDQLDETFLAALVAYIQAADKQRQPDLAVRLTKIHQQILSQVAQRLPPEMQVLDLVLRLKEREERLSILKEAAQGKGDKVPVCGITTLRANSSQLLSDMEDQDAVPDRRLLARLCIVREEIAELAADLSPQGQADALKDVYQSNIMLHTQQVPQGTIHFLKELMTVSDATKRRGILQQAFSDEFKYEASQVSGRSQSKRAKKSNMKAVRPGSFLTCLTATQFEMNNMKQVDMSLERIETIRKEALQILEALAD